jgi:hypothetical protein
MLRHPFLSIYLVVKNKYLAVKSGIFEASALEINSFNVRVCLCGQRLVGTGVLFVVNVL